MRIPRSRGAVSGLLLMVLGAWGALIPFIGPYFDVSVGTDQTWDWWTGRLWLSVLPGVVAFVGGFLTFRSAHRATAGFGAWMAIAAGAWLAVGPTVSMLWNDGTSAAGAPLGSTNERVLETLVMFEGLGVVIAILGAFALGRLAVRSVKDVELAREAELARERNQVASEQRVERERTPATVPVGAGARSSDEDRTAVLPASETTVVPSTGRSVPTRDPTYERTSEGATAVVPPPKR
jgi:hypothetical protein